MRGFKTYIITKRTLIKFAVIALAVITLVFVLIGAVKKPREAEAVAVFSNVAERILDEGITTDKDKFSAEDIAEEILGFDKDDPVSIINSSSAALENHNNTSPSPLPTKAPKKLEPSSVTTQTPKATDAFKINNATNYEIDIDELLKKPMEIKLEKTDYEVLIVHTHTTECYNGNEMTGEAERTTNERYNMCRIGEIVAETLEKYGIKTIHDKTIHDYPSYQGAYTRALKTIEKNLKEHPSIKVVLDIHRDAYIYADGSKLRVATEINGESVAQVMLVLGTDSMGLEHSRWRENLTLAAKVQERANTKYPGLMRSLNLRRERFNMHATTGSLLLEIGSNGNSMAEAEKAAEYIGDSIASVLTDG